MGLARIGILAAFLVFVSMQELSHAGDCGSIIYMDVGSNGNSSSGSSSDTWKNEPAYVPPSDGSSSSGGKPDFIVPELYVKNHKAVFRPGEDMKIMVRVKNIGNATPNHDVKIKYWRSDGYQIDPKDDRKKIDTDNIKSSNLDPGGVFIFLINWL